MERKRSKTAKNGKLSNMLNFELTVQSFGNNSIEHLTALFQQRDGKFD
jgi:hypothetical protein